MKKIQFIRFGGLSSVPQKGYDPEMPSFHSPPARRGIYAFVWPQIEYFLLGGSFFDQRRMRWVKNEKGDKVKTEEYKEFSGYNENRHFSKEEPKIQDRGMRIRRMEDELTETGQRYLAEDIRPKKFSYEGEIWSHLDAPREVVLLRRGSWVLTSFSDYAKALQKEVGRMADHKKRMGIGFSKDHLEVFIEKV